jgi:hypothetical protein
MFLGLALVPRLGHASLHGKRRDLFVNESQVELRQTFGL